MSFVPYHLLELLTLDDPLLLPWLDLYEISFPPDERVPVSRILNVLHEHARGAASGQHLLAAVPDSLLAPGQLSPNYRVTDQRITALLYTYEPPASPAAFLWYFAVQPGLRGQGLGSRLYRDVLARLGPQARALIFDLEDPDQMESPAGKEQALRRVAFYQRLGARVLGGIEYIQRCADHLPPLRLLLMIHPVKEITPGEAYDLAKAAMPEAVRQVGELRWVTIQS